MQGQWQLRHDRCTYRPDIRLGSLAPPSPPIPDPFALQAEEPNPPPFYRGTQKIKQFLCCPLFGPYFPQPQFPERTEWSQGGIARRLHANGVHREHVSFSTSAAISVSAPRTFAATTRSPLLTRGEIHTLRPSSTASPSPTTSARTLSTLVSSPHHRAASRARLPCSPSPRRLMSAPIAPWGHDRATVRSSLPACPLLPAHSHRATPVCAARHPNGQATKGGAVPQLPVSSSDPRLGACHHGCRPPASILRRQIESR